MGVLTRNNVKVAGVGERAMMFAHGYGCDQTMWRLVAPAFESTHRVVTFDLVGSGASDLSAYNRVKYGSLNGYADDVLEICHALVLTRIVFVGHSVSAMIGVLAAIKEPRCFEKMVMIGPSPRYLDNGDYKGGFSEGDIEGLLDALDSNYLGWSRSMAPVIMGNPDRPELSAELANSLCRADPEIARHFGRVTFLADNRADLPKLQIKTLILQCAEDRIAPEAVGEYVHRHVRGSALMYLKATGHCPHLSAPDETIRAIRAFV